MNHILELHRYTIFAVKDSGAEYDVASVDAFDCEWVDCIMDEYFIEYPKANSQSTLFLVMIPSFIGTNWYEVKYHMV